MLQTYSLSRPPGASRTYGVFALLFFMACAPALRAQDRLPTMHGYERYRAQTRKMRDLLTSAQAGSLDGTWTQDSKGFVYRKDSKYYRYDVITQQSTATEEKPSRNTTGSNLAAGFLERGRQFAVSVSPDKRLKATYKDGNIILSPVNGVKNDVKNELKADEKPALSPIPVPFTTKSITTNGGKQTRTFYGTASWVYGEELEQHTAMWWSPDSKKLAYYGFDESKVPDYYVTLNNLQVQDQLDAEPYPKAGAPNPVVDLYIYDVESGQNVRMDVRDGKPFTDEAVGHYVYAVQWSPDGKELLFNRTNRLQNILEFTACDPKTGHCRVIVREAWPASWTANLPTIQFLKDGQRFVWTSERTGWRNLYLYDLSGKLLAPLTKHEFDIERILRVDETGGLLYYMAHAGDDPLKRQLYRVTLGGTGDSRLTDPKFDHRVDLAPDGRTFADIAQTHDQPPSTRIVSIVSSIDKASSNADIKPTGRSAGKSNGRATGKSDAKAVGKSDGNAQGKIVATLAQGDISALTAAGFAPPELFTYKANDGKTDLYGMLYKPSDFDPNKKYPLLVDVYAGPETPQAEMVTETFARPRSVTELGFLLAVFDGRGTTRRGKAFMDAVYGRLGQAEIDDQASGVKFLRQRPYVDGGRVGVYGTSYGGYASLMCLLRYPDVFQAASASSAVTDWRNYDSIYTERFMGLPSQNQKGYEAGAAATYAKDLKGKLLLYYGTADNNVHPSNTLQLIAALQSAGKSYELQVGPDEGHSGVNQNRMLEFFIDNLILKPAEAPKPITQK